MGAFWAVLSGAALFLPLLINDYVGADMLVSESIPTAFGIIQLASGDPVKAIMLSTNLGGDADTIGAITGSVCGAWAGAADFPDDWLKTLETVNHPELTQLAARLVELYTHYSDT